jgi:hypothetical protein
VKNLCFSPFLFFFPPFCLTSCLSLYLLSFVRFTVLSSSSLSFFLPLCHCYPSIHFALQRFMLGQSDRFSFLVHQTLEQTRTFAYRTVCILTEKINCKIKRRFTPHPSRPSRGALVAWRSTTAQVSFQLVGYRSSGPTCVSEYSSGEPEKHHEKYRAG